MSDKWSDRSTMASLRSTRNYNTPRGVVNGKQSLGVASNLQKTRLMSNVERFSSGDLHEVVTDMRTFDQEIDSGEASRLKRISVFTFDS